MNKALSEPDEIQLLAIPLARTMHLQRLVAIDSQYDGVRMTQVAEKELDAIENDKKNLAYQDAANSPLYKKEDIQKNHANASGNLLSEYAYLNSSEYMQADIDTQWGAWWRMQLPNGVDRFRYAMWELRNLRIASNIANAAASLKHQRVLIIVGAAHKPFLDNYLSRRESVRLVQFPSLVGAGEKVSATPSQPQ